MTEKEKEELKKEILESKEFEKKVKKEVEKYFAGRLPF